MVVVVILDSKALRYQQEFGYKTIDELIAEFEAKNKTNKTTEKAIDLTRELTESTETTSGYS